MLFADVSGAPDVSFISRPSQSFLSDNSGVLQL